VADPINVKVCLVVLKYGRLIEGPPKQRGKFLNPEHVVLEGPKCEMENALTFKTRNIVYKEVSKL
jgi:hypothetical protein